jgi:small conductance mechanosensitive channel
MNPLQPAAQEAFSIADPLIRVGLIVVGTIAAIRVSYFLIGRLEKAIRLEGRGTEIAREMRAHTVVQVLRQVARVVLTVIGVMMGLRGLGLDITPALAAAGGFGVAAGLGAQALIRDWIAGFFIVHDNQFAVGDAIRVAGVSGTVETLSLRHTELRDAEGFIHYIPNGEIKVVTNLTKSWSTPLVRIPVSLVEDPDRVLTTVESLLVSFRENPKVKEQLLDGPRLLGIDDVGAGQFTILIQAKTVPEQRLAVARALRLAVLERLRDEGISTQAAAGAAPVSAGPESATVTAGPAPATPTTAPEAT